MEEMKELIAKRLEGTIDNFVERRYLERAYEQLQKPEPNLLMSQAFIEAADMHGRRGPIVRSELEKLEEMKELIAKQLEGSSNNFVKRRYLERAYEQLQKPEPNLLMSQVFMEAGDRLYKPCLETTAGESLENLAKLKLELTSEEERSIASMKIKRLIIGD